MSPNAKRLLWIFGAAAGAVGLLYAADSSRKASDREAAIARGNAAKARFAMDEWLRKPITPRVLKVGDMGVLLVLDVPNNDNGLAVMQRCYVWRDAQLGTSSMSCEASGGSLLTGPP